MYLKGHIAIANVQHPTFDADLNNLQITELFKKNVF